jgi:predicted Rossmann fold flavoprotein
MKISIVGGGASGIYAAILYKKNHPHDEVFILDKEEKLGRKLYATGNGHCNLLNKNLEADKYNNPEFIAPYLKRYPFAYLEKTLLDLGIATFALGDLVYPLTFSATSFVIVLEKLLKQNSIIIHANTKLIDYKREESGYVLLTDKGNFTCDKILFAVGGESTPNLGSDGSLYSCFKNHHYQIINPLPGLSPLVVKDKQFMAPLSGIRHFAKIKAYEDKELLYVEDGEVLYKDDGLSGIAIFNCESIIERQRNSKPHFIEIDLFPEFHNLEKDLKEGLAKIGSLALESYLVPPLLNEVLRQAHLSSFDINDSHLDQLTYAMHHLRYEFSSPYPFKNSQVTLGGISLKEVKPTLESKSEPGVFFLGEVLDIDGLCGGYNLSWALISALIASEAL